MNSSEHVNTPQPPTGHETPEAAYGWTPDSLFPGDDDTARVHRLADWASTPLGPVETWPTELTAAVSTVFASDIAMLLWLGPNLVQVFNDAYRPFLGVKYPAAVGQPAAQCWPEVWDEMGPLAQWALEGRTSRGTEVRLLMDRRGGLPEETYWTFSYSPIRRVDAGVVGVFVATSDVTASVLARRRMNTVQQLGSISATRGQHPVATCRTATSTLCDSRDGLPLVMTYLDPVATFDTEREHRLGSRENTVTLVDGRTVELVAVGGELGPNEAHAWLADGPGVKAIASVVDVGAAEHLRGLSGDGNGRGPHVDGVPLDDVVVLPLRMSGREEPVGVLVVGVSPFHSVDREYHSFLDVVAGRLSTTLTDVLAYEYERQRSTALAAVDAAKTQFLENVSHEFRTPLTLLLAPLRGLLESSNLGDRETVETAHRNAVRLRELVDSLLDIAGASTGAILDDREPADIVELTHGCVAQFDSVLESSDLSLHVDLDAVESREVMIDREKWTRIVTNLVSNAFKYTHSGSIHVALSGRGSDIVLHVVDTGIGIASDDLPHVFDRFYRVRDARGRSAEGSGIGLALVAELTAAMGGTVSVDSVVGEGSTFTVVVPAEAVRTSESASRSLDTNTDEAHVGSAVPRGQVTTHRGVRGGGTRSVLVVEDNPDMAEYLVRLLTAQNWDVHMAGDVDSGLAHAHAHRPDLVLTDVMLPGRSGLELVADLRSDASLVRVPVIVLSARAGTSSAVEGLETGADDYVTKPFEPRELVARVRAHLELSAIREEILAASDNETATLHEALRTRSTIGTAIGLLMAQESCDSDTAFRRLTTLSQNSNRKARDVAEEMVRNYAR